MHSIGLFCEGVDYISEGRQRLVNLLRLIQTFSSSTRDTNALATSQIYEVKLAYADRFRLISCAYLLLCTAVKVNSTHLLDDDQEDCVGAR